MSSDSPRKVATLHPYHSIPFVALFLTVFALSFTPGGALMYWFLLAAGEAVYQLLAPDTAFFKNIMETEARETRRKQAEEARLNAGMTLGKYSDKYRQITHLEDTIRSHVLTRPREIRDVLAPLVARAGALVRGFLRLAKARNDFDAFLTRSQEATLIEQATGLKARQAMTSDIPAAVLAMEAKRLKMVESRLVKIHQVRERCPLMEAQMDTLFEAMNMLYDQVMAPVTGANVRIDVDGILQDAEDNGAEGVTDLMHDMEDIDQEMDTLDEMSRGSR